MTPDEAKAAGYISFSEHRADVPCPREPGGYCNTCDGLTSKLAARRPSDIELKRRKR